MSTLEPLVSATGVVPWVVWESLTPGPWRWPDSGDTGSLRPTMNPNTTLKSLIGCDFRSHE